MILSQKADLRKKMLKLQQNFISNLSPKEKHSLSEILCEKVTSLQEYQKSDFIFTYIPTVLEADCTPIILDAVEKGKKVAVPKVDFQALKKGLSEMDFYLIKNNLPLEEQLENGTYGILEPKPDLEKVLMDEVLCSEEKNKPFMLVPGVAFTKDCKRLGHGKGFYDIYIEKMRKNAKNPFLCGVCLPCQIVENLPTDEHDILMDKVIF